MAEHQPVYLRLPTELHQAVRKRAETEWPSSSRTRKSPTSPNGEAIPLGLDPTPPTNVGRHIAWRDDIRMTCTCGHHKGSHALGGRCLTHAIPPAPDGGPGCPCPAFQPQEDDDGKGRDG